MDEEIKDLETITDDIKGSPVVEEKPVIKKDTNIASATVKGFIAGAALMFGGDIALVEPMQREQAEAYADSLAHEEYVLDSLKYAMADSTNKANLNLKDSVFYQPARAKEKGQMGFAQINPLYYQSPEEQILVMNYRISGKDTVLLGVSIVDNKEYWLFDQKNKSIPTPKPR
jgi:hypothetical protein